MNGGRRVLAEAGCLGAGALGAFGFGVWQFGPDWWREWGSTFYAPYSLLSLPLFGSPYVALLLVVNLRMAFLLGRMAWRRGGTRVLWVAGGSLAAGFALALCAAGFWYQVTVYAGVSSLARDALWSACFALLASFGWVPVLFLAAFASLRAPGVRAT